MSTAKVPVKTENRNQQRLQLSVVDSTWKDSDKICWAESQSVVSFTPLETKSLPELHRDSLDTQSRVTSLVTSTDTRWDPRDLREAGERISIF